MTFDEALAQVIEFLQRQGRVSYSPLKRRFDFDDAYLAGLRAELSPCCSKAGPRSRTAWGKS
jgi:hypothetical protein